MTQGVRRWLRVAIGALVAVAVAGAVWRSAPSGLRPPEDIVGGSTFSDYDYHRVFLAYRLLVWEPPVVFFAVYLALRRRGPLAGTRRAPEVRPLTDAPHAAAAVPGDPAVAPPSAAGWLRVVPTVLLLALATSAHGTDPGQRLSTVGVAFGAGLVIVLLVATMVLSRRGAGRRDARARSHAVLGGPAAALALAWFVRHSAVVGPDVHRYPWLPLWLLGVAAATVPAGVAVGLRHRPADVVESRVVSLAVLPVLVFCVTTAMHGDVGPIQGFDDMQGLTGADLLSRGLFPWRDVLFIHGVFEDAWRSNLGFVLFGHTMWATFTARTVLWLPLLWVGYYLLGVWVARGRLLPSAVVAAAVVWVAGWAYTEVRWLVAAPLLVLLGEAVRRARVPWTVALTVALFVEAVLVPEAVFQVVAVTAVLVGVDLVHRPRRRSWWRELVRTRVYVGTGLVLSVLWAGFLASRHALSEFVGFYLLVGPGHDAAGVLPVPTYTTTRYRVLFVLMVGLAVVTLWAGAVAWLSRRFVSSRDWVALAAALTTALYAEKALGRFDDGHVLQVGAVGATIAVVWVAGLTCWLDDAAYRLLRRRTRRPWPGVLAQPVSVVALAAVLVGLPSVARDVTAVPAHDTAAVSGHTDARIGWDVPHALPPGLLHDLRAVVSTYHRYGGVFDFTNSPGYFYYLLRQRPPTSYFQISLAEPESAQQDVVRQLKRSRPALVAFDSPPTMGLPTWDGPLNEVRHFIVAQYVLDHWTPVLRTHGVLFLARNDLLDRLPTLPPLREPAEVTDLYSDAAACDLGDTADFLTSEPAGTPLALTVGAAQAQRETSFTGWAYDVAARRPVASVLVASGDQVLAVDSATLARSDVAESLQDPDAVQSGFGGTQEAPTAAPIAFYAVLSDGRAHPIAGAPATSGLVLHEADGTAVAVDPAPAPGNVDQLSQVEVTTSRVDLPPGTRLADYQLMTLSSASGDLGTGRVELSDRAGSIDGREHRIALGTLPVAGRSVSARVGSCLQWHGYDGPSLYLVQQGLAHPVDRLVLSGIRPSS